MKIALIGPYPPPYGGISIHIKRTKLFLKSRNISTTIYNESNYTIKSDSIVAINYKKFIFKVPFIKADILHFHSSSKKVRMLLGFYKIFGKNIILTLHGERLKDQLDDSNYITRKLLIKSLKNLNKIICVNPKVVNELISLGVAANKVSYLPAYIKPIEDEYDFKNIPEYVSDFINDTEFLISSNGAIRFYNSQDLYGLDMIIELMDKLKNNFKTVKLIFCVLDIQSQSEKEKRYYYSLQKRIKRLNIEDKILLYEVNNTEFYPILKKSKLFLRPTNTDGYGVSIAEALYYKVPSIASDVCKRPQGTIIFKPRDINDLYIKTVDVLKNYNLYKEKLKDNIQYDNAETLLNIYKELSLYK